MTDQVKNNSSTGGTGGTGGTDGTGNIDLTNPEDSMEESSKKSMAFQATMMAISLKNSMFSAATQFIMEMHKSMKDFAADAAKAQGKSH